MALDIMTTRNGINIRSFSVENTLEDVLRDQYWVSGYGDPNGACSIVIHDAIESESPDLLEMRGYGKAETFERACARALFTHILREERGMDYVNEDDFYESKHGIVPFPAHLPSRIDYVVKEGDLRLVQGKSGVIARSNYYTKDRPEGSPMIEEVCGQDAMTALGKLAAAYVFDTTMREQTASLPATNFRYGLLDEI